VNPKFDLFDDISRCQLWGIPYLKFGYRRAIKTFLEKAFSDTLGLFRQLLRYFQQTSGFFINQQLTLFTTSDFLVYGSRFVTVGHGWSRFVTVCPDSNTPLIYTFCNYVSVDSNCTQKNVPSKALFPTNMAPVCDKHGPFRQCIQILGTLDMYPNIGYIPFFFAYFKTRILMVYLYIYIYIMIMEVSWNGGTPSHHPLGLSLF